MRWESQWMKLLVLVIVLALVGVIGVDQELKPFTNIWYTTEQERLEAIKVQWTASGDEMMLVNPCQTYSFVGFSFVFLMAAHNLVLLRTPMQLTRYPTWSAYRRTVFGRLMVFSLLFLGIVTTLVVLAEQYVQYLGLAKLIYISKQIYPKAMTLFALHMVLCTAMVCLYQVKAIFARNYLLTQALPMVFFVASATIRGTWIQRISPFSFPVYDRMPEGGLLRVVLTYAVCFGALIYACRKPKSEYITEAKI